MPSTEPVIETRDLTKFYGKRKGIEKLNLTVHQGEIFGFLGPNGAGKTTTIRIFLDILRPSSGSVSIFGMDVRQNSFSIRKRIGYLPGDLGLYDHMTGREFLSFIRKFHGHLDEVRIDSLAERFQIDLSIRIKTCSKGMKQKIAIIMAFFNDPDLYILDEPTLGLDPLFQQEFYRLLLEERNRGKTVFLSSHILSEVEKVCGRVGIIREGRLVVEENIEDLKRKRVKIVTAAFKGLCQSQVLTALEGISRLEENGEIVTFAYRGDVDELVGIFHKLSLKDLSIRDATLEEIFFEYY